MIGDLRYDREAGFGFAELSALGACGDRSAPWVAPLVLPRY
jgi:hypothetical protein